MLTWSNELSKLAFKISQELELNTQDKQKFRMQYTKLELYPDLKDDPNLVVSEIREFKSIIAFETIANIIIDDGGIIYDFNLDTIMHQGFKYVGVGYHETIESRINYILLSNMQPLKERQKVNYNFNENENENDKTDDKILPFMFN